MEKEVIKIGTKITVLLDGGKLMTLIIGASNRGDLALGVISCDAPLARAILGKKEGEEADYCVADEIHRVKITSVS